MILQALANYYESLVDQGILDRPGWSKIKVSYALELDSEGNLVDIHSLKSEVTQGKKTILLPTEKSLPALVKRSSNVSANFLCDNSSYILGIDDKDNKERTYQCHDASKLLHLSLLKDIDTPCANALRRFFENWDKDKAYEILSGYEVFHELISGANIVFLVGDDYAQDDPLIAEAWQNHYDRSSEDSETMQIDLITGEMVVPERTHPSIKGIPGAQSSGAAIVTFDKDAFCSYGKKQNLNAPVGKYASFAYTSALNHLIADREHRKTVGDTVVVYWAENGGKEYQDAFSVLLDCDSAKLDDSELNEAMDRISRGKAISFDDHILNPDSGFYILGIAPNAGRLSVRFFYRDSFGDMVKNLYRHFQQTEIIPDNKAHSTMIPLWRLLKATVNDKAKDKTPVPKMAGETLRAIITGGRYPASIYQQVQLRIKADHDVSHERMAIVKGYLLRNDTAQNVKEVITVQLNENTEYQPYVLGRLFAVLEALQETANPGLNATIKDKYFSSASATPGIVFPILLNLKDKHLHKLEDRLRIYYEKQISELMMLIKEDYPVHMTLQDQGVFQIGYYHQKQKRYEKKNKEEA